MKKGKIKINKQNLAFFGKVLILIISAVSIVFIAASSFSNVTFSNIKGTIESFFINLKSGGGFPYECSVDGASKVDSVGSYLAVIDESNIIYLNKTAKEVLRFDSTYTKPDIAVSNGRALVYNRGTSSFLVTGQSDILYKSTDTAGILDGSIITANIGKRGNLAFATLMKDGTSKFTALNKKLKPDFYYVFGDNRILYVTLSDNGKYGACAVFGAENATYYSEVYVFDFDESEPIKKVKYPNETVIRLDFLKSGKLNVITDLKRRVVEVGEKEDADIVDYSAHNLISIDFDVSSKRSVLCYSKYGSTNNIVSAFYKNGNESCKIENVENVKKVSCTSNRIAVLTDDKILCYNYAGKLKATIDLSFNIDSIEYADSSLYLFSGAKIYKIKANRDMTFEVE